MLCLGSSWVKEPLSLPSYSRDARLSRFAHDNKEQKAYAAMTAAGYAKVIELNTSSRGIPVLPVI
jgi:hypothetical protein